MRSTSPAPLPRTPPPRHPPSTSAGRAALQEQLWVCLGFLGGERDEGEQRTNRRDFAACPLPPHHRRRLLCSPAQTAARRRSRKASTAWHSCWGDVWLASPLAPGHSPEGTSQGHHVSLLSHHMHSAAPCPPGAGDILPAESPTMDRSSLLLGLVSHWHWWRLLPQVCSAESPPASFDGHHCFDPTLVPALLQSTSEAEERCRQTAAIKIRCRFQRHPEKSLPRSQLLCLFTSLQLVSI